MMRVLYFLEPTIELGRPLFRLPTIRNHLDQEMRALASHGGSRVDVRLVCAERVYRAARDEGLLSGIAVFALSHRELKSVSSDAYAASLAWFDGSYDNATLERAMALYRRVLGSFQPDVIVCYESSAPYLERLFPEALLLHDTLGIFSRPPYPRTSALDPFGLGRHAYLAREAARLRALPISEHQRAQLTALKSQYQRAQRLRSPVTAQSVRGSFERVVLLPLQVSRYFMYDAHCPPSLRGRPQAELVAHVLERVPREVGVYVSLHSGDASWQERGTLGLLRRSFPNLLFDPAVQSVPWTSQHVLPHVDAVVSVASSVALQALLWDLPVLNVGHSHLAGVASAMDLSALPQLLHAGPTRALDATLHHLLTHYYPDMDRYHYRGAWFIGFLGHMLAWHRAGRAGDPFRPIAQPHDVYAGLHAGLRLPLQTRELEAWSQKQGATVARPEGGFEAALARAELVSFDVFDTLVTRPFLAPRTLFHVIAPRAVGLLQSAGVEVRGLDFAALRERAIAPARAAAAARGSEEYTLDDVYAWLLGALAPHAAIAELCAQLAELEEQAELAVARPLPAGLALLARARAAGKRVVLISDSYLSQASLEAILASAGVRGFHALYASSAAGCCKRSGALFERVRAEEGGVRAWLHVGDDTLTDERVPARLGIATFRADNPSARYLAERYVRQRFPALSAHPDAGPSIAHGLIAQRRAAKDPGSTSHYGGSLQELGYAAGGPLLSAFAVWLWERMHRDGVTDVYFLARDGVLPKACVEALFSGRTGPRLHLLHASRRLYAVPLLRTEADVLALAARKFYPRAIGDLLVHRFGLSAAELPLDVLQAHGFASAADVVDDKNLVQRARIEGLLRALAPRIFAAAERERSVLCDYLRSAGLYDPDRRIALVDIGHNASLQEALSVLTRRDDLRGYYFATYREAERVHASGLDVASYLLEFEDAESSAHPYCRGVGMFEFLFLPPTRSIVGLRREGSAFVPQLVEGDEERRIALSAELENGVLDFVRDLRAATLGRPELLRLAKVDALLPYASFVAKPERADAAMFEGVSFVDAFGGAPQRYLVPPHPSAEGAAAARAYLSQAWWKEGARALAVLPQFDLPQFAVSVPDWQKKLRKLQRDPELFFLDSRVKPLRWLGRGLLSAARVRERLRRRS